MVREESHSRNYFEKLDLQDSCAYCNDKGSVNLAIGKIHFSMCILTPQFASLFSMPYDKYIFKADWVSLHCL